MKIATQKGEHSSKCTELSLKRKEGKHVQSRKVSVKHPKDLIIKIIKSTRMKSKLKY